jgi:dihydrofolate synthase/folylpolyglutamate synthase
MLCAELERSGVAPAAIRRCEDVAAALAAAREQAGEADRIIVFGSFLTVAAALVAARPGAHPAQRHG